MALIGDSSWNDAVFITCGAILLILGVGVVRELTSCQFLSRLRRVWAGVKTAILASGAAADDIDLMVQARMQSQKLQHFRWICKALCIAAGPIAPSIMFNIGTGAVRNYTPMQDITFLWVTGLLVLLLVFPWLLSSRTLDAFYTLIMLGALVHASPPAVTPESAAEALLSAGFVVFVLTIMRRGVVLTSLMNCAFIVSASTTIRIHVQGPATRPASLTFLQVVVIITASICAHAIEVSIAAEIRQGLEMQATKELLAAASALLRSCHDVVVELDAQGGIVGHAEQLSSFLLRESVGDMKGSKLSDLMHEQDRPSFAEMLRKQQESVSDLVEATHVSMQDSDGNTLRLEVMAFQFRHVDRQLRYMVGLREFADFSRSGAGQTATGGEVAELGAGLGSSLTLPEETSVVTASEDEATVVVFLDCSRDGYPVRSCSPGFRMRIGHLAPGMSFVSIVKNSANFVRWLQHALNLDYQDIEPEEYSLTLNMPQGGIRARCRLLPEYETSGTPATDAEDDLERVHLQFTRIRRCPQQV